MPNYDGTNTVPVITSSSNRGGYIGFYDSEEGVDTWIGSLGFDQDGNGYIVTSKIESGNIIYKKTKIGDSYIIGTGLSLTDGTLNHSNSITPQTTQALYPITIDAQGHIATVGEAITSLGYTQTFTATDWSNLTITITAATHGCGISPSVDIYYLDSTLYKKAWGLYTTVDWNIEIDSSGNITLKTLTAFAGKIVVR
jgi:hypothetical protein